MAPVATSTLLVQPVASPSSPAEPPTVLSASTTLTPDPPASASPSATASSPDDPMHEVIPHLWLGDYQAATNPELLREHGISYVISALSWKPKVVAGMSYLHVEVDDTPDADLLAHLPSCIQFIASALSSTPPQPVLVHCQAGVSRSATILTAYLMSSLSLPLPEALALVRKARPQACPSETFLRQLEIFGQSGFKVSRKDKATRRWYLGRTAEEVMNGDGSPIPLTMLASWPLTPSSSSPSTPLTSSPAPKRRIRCKKCRRELATREHMLDHQVGPGTQPSTPYPQEGGDPMEQRTSLSRPNSRPQSRAGSRRSSQATADRPPLPALPQLSMSALDLPTSGAGPPTAPSAGAAGGVEALRRRRSSAGAPSPLAQELPPPSEPLSATVESLSTPTIPEDAVAPNTAIGEGAVGGRPPVRKPSLRRSFGAGGIGGMGGLTMTTLSSTPSAVANGAVQAAKDEHADSAVSEDDDEPLPPHPSHPSHTPHPGSGSNAYTHPGLQGRSATHSGPLLAGSALNANLPPALAALRSVSASAASTLPLSSSTTAAGTGLPGRKPSFNLQMSKIGPTPTPTPTSTPGTANGQAAAADDPPSGVQGIGVPLPAGVLRVADREKGYFSPPILANAECSGYFLEPMKWMDFLEAGEMGGPIYCPNKKCNAKLGNYDWAGVRCGCREWITPGFCIHKSKVDEDL